MNQKMVVSTLAGLIIAVGLTGCFRQNASSTSEADEPSTKLQLAADEQQLKTYLTAQFTSLRSDAVYLDASLPEPADASQVTSPSASESSNEAFSGTNTQVAGVDEGDIWKYDGEHFYILKSRSNHHCQDDVLKSPEVDPLDMTDCDAEPSSAQVRIVKNTQESVSTVALGELNPTELYLEEGHLAVLGNRSNHPEYRGSFVSWQSGLSQIRIIDVAKPSEPKQTFEIDLDGYVVQSRRLGDELILVSRFTPSLPNLINYPQNQAQVKQNRSLLEATPLKQILPSITINSTEQALVDASQCWIADTPSNDWGYPSLSTITRFNIKTGTFTSRCIAGQVDGLYMSTEHLYLHRTSYWHNTADSNIAVDSGDATSQPFMSDILPPHSAHTLVHQFKLDEHFNYQGSGLVKGELGRNHTAFRIGELADGSLSLVTSSGVWNNPEHYLTVLKAKDGMLEKVSQLPNSLHPEAIGKPGERIYSVRFMQNRAYIVTFQKVDPLYVIDLTNPAEPYIAGELEIPGFSDYLHPIGDDLLLGVGKNAATGVSGTTWFQGIKVGLFDVAQIENPQALGSISIGRRDSETALSYDHHAFTGLFTSESENETYRFAFPIRVHDTQRDDMSIRDPESEGFDWTYSGLHLFEVENKTLTAAGVMVTEKNQEGASKRYRSMSSSRGLIQGEDVYHLSGAQVFHANWHTPEQMSEPF